ncbi:MAG: GtrA family protein [Streptococcaceae bacterium]|jgi:putative flippase GtrA|nr:GtrA family protein [Streptococcaceae bacterium]
MEKIKKFVFSEGFRYLFFGGLATLVYAIVKFATYHALQSGWLSETIAQSASIIFAFITNKFWVFKHKSDSLLKDFATFVAGRLLLLFFSIGMNFWFVDQHPEILTKIFGIDKNTMVAGLNLFLQVFIIVVNYIYSKFIVFKKKKD